MVKEKKPTATKTKIVKEKLRYNLTIKLNDQVFTCKTNDIAQALMSFKPSVVKTKMYVKVEDGKKSCERQVFVFRAKQIFRNKLSMDIFIRTLIFK